MIEALGLAKLRRCFAQHSAILGRIQLANPEKGKVKGERDNEKHYSFKTLHLMHISLYFKE